MSAEVDAQSMRWHVRRSAAEPGCWLWGTERETSSTEERAVSRHTRLDTILDMLSQKGNLDVEGLVEALGVSAATVRRDLDSLAEQQLLTRTHGGAVPT